MQVVCLRSHEAQSPQTMNGYRVCGPLHMYTNWGAK